MYKFQEISKQIVEISSFFEILDISKYVAVSGDPKPKVLLKLSTSTLGFFEEIYQYARETIQTENSRKKPRKT